MSIALQAVLSGLTYQLYRSIIRTGEFERGEISAWAIELTAICYVVIPYLIGWLVGEGVKRNVLSLRLIVRGSPEPRAWDFLFSHRQPNGVIRIKLKSGQYIAGVFGISADGKQSHASGYPEAGDLYMSQSVAVDGVTGEFLECDQGRPKFGSDGILVRWEEVEFLEIFE